MNDLQKIRNTISGPIKLEVKGDGAKAFVFDGAGNLHTATRLSHAKKQRFLLTVGFFLEILVFLTIENDYL